MATGRSNGRPRKPKNKTDFRPENITDELFDKLPTAPEDLTEDGALLWYRIWSGGHGWLIDADHIIVHDLCQIYQDKELYRRAIDLGSVPRVYRMPNGILTPHPYINLLKNARQEITAHLSSIGFNPTDRAKLGAMESLAEDPLVDMIKRKQEREALRRINND